MNKRAEGGGFTLPGESGYEALTLRLADKWGADMIRDSDGTALSEEILNAGYGIYSTLCVIRGHNRWAEAHPGHLQQCFLMTPPALAEGESLDIPLLAAFSDEQFQVNETPPSLARWQVFDRTTGMEVSRAQWHYENGVVRIRQATPFHRYTINFLVWRIWEEISMYNHVTNDWTAERLAPLEPQYPAVQAYLLRWMEDWCKSHPATTVVRFTTLFYNFVWIWGSDARNRNRFVDWASYDFTVSLPALEAFEREYGYSLLSEDFINMGKLHATHMPPDQKKRDWMDFTNRFVVSFGRKLVDIVHRHGKQAYFFYDDSWVGMEPYGERFPDFGFDGVIKCVFSGFEARLCAGVPTAVHELRLHPYLFPVGLAGKPTFMEGGDPTADARAFWMRIRRALLRQPVERIGLGGYLHLMESFPDFEDYIEALTTEFRMICRLHRTEAPAALPLRVAVLHSWGALRSWTLSGHFHETDSQDLIHILEALSGLPVEVSFIDFEQAKASLKEYDAVINAGFAGSAWSGGAAWEDAALVTALTRWVYEGGCFLGIGQPSACPGADAFFRMAHVLGVDEDTGGAICHGKWPVNEAESSYSLRPRCLKMRENLFLTTPDAQVFACEGGVPLFVQNWFGRGRGIYLSSFSVGAHNARLLLEIFAGAGGGLLVSVPDNPYLDAAWFAAGRQLLLANQSGETQRGRVCVEGTVHPLELAPYALQMLKL